MFYFSVLDQKKSYEVVRKKSFEKKTTLNLFLEKLMSVAK